MIRAEFKEIYGEREVLPQYQTPPGQIKPVGGLISPDETLTSPGETLTRAHQGFGTPGGHFRKMRRRGKNNFITESQKMSCLSKLLNFHFRMHQNYRKWVKFAEKS